MQDLSILIATLEGVYVDLEKVLAPQPIHQKRTYQLEEALRQVAATVAILRGVRSEGVV